MIRPSNFTHSTTKISRETPLRNRNRNIARRIFLMTSISYEEITNLLIVYLQHLHPNLISESMLSALSYVKEVIQSSVVYSPICWCHVGGTALQFVEHFVKVSEYIEKV